MSASEGLRALISAAWQLDDVILPIEMLQALESGRALHVGELSRAAEAMGVPLSELMRAIED